MFQVAAEECAVLRLKRRHMREAKGEHAG